MQVKNLVIEEIRSLRVNTKNKTAEIQIKFLNESPLTTTIRLEEDLEKMTFKLLKWVKDAKKGDSGDFDGSFLSGISLVHIDNHEDIEDIAPKGFYRLTNRLSNFKRITDAREYMRAYGQMSTQQEVIYKKSSREY